MHESSSASLAKIFICFSQTQPLLLLITHTHLISSSISYHHPDASALALAENETPAECCLRSGRPRATRLISVLRGQQKKGQKRYGGDHTRGAVGSTKNYSSPLTLSSWAGSWATSAAGLPALSVAQLWNTNELFLLQGRRHCRQLVRQVCFNSVSSHTC